MYVQRNWDRCLQSARLPKDDRLDKYVKGEATLGVHLNPHISIHVQLVILSTYFSSVELLIKPGRHSVVLIVIYGFLSGERYKQAITSNKLEKALG